MGVTELVPPGGELCACHIRKRIDRERIETERSLDRQASKRICIIVSSQRSEGQYDPRHMSGQVRTRDCVVE